MEEHRKSPEDIDLLGGKVCLDFSNTLDWHASAHPVESLFNYADLVTWSRHAGIVNPRAAQKLLDQAASEPATAAKVYDRAVALREATFRIFSAVAKGARPRAEDLAKLNQELSRALAHAAVVDSADGFVWDWKSAPGALDSVLWPIARSAAGLLTSPALDRVRECADTVDGCGWLFIDTSRNRSRQWCDMKSCGNRAKARRFQARLKRAAARPAKRTRSGAAS